MKLANKFTAVMAIAVLLGVSTTLLAQQGPQRQGRWSQKDQSERGPGRFGSDMPNRMRSPQGTEEFDAEDDGPQNRRQRGDRPDRRNPQRDGRGMQRPQLMFSMRLHDALRQLDLSTEQLEQVKEILREAAEDRRENHGESAEEIRELRQQMAQARKDWDREAFEELQDELRELMEDRKEDFDQVSDKLSKVLTDEQMTKLKQLMSPAGAFKRMLEAVNKLDLSSEQSAKIKKIATETQNSAKSAEDKKEKVRTYLEGGKKVMDVLTNKQKQQLHDKVMNKARSHMQLMKLFAGLDLSEQQKQQIGEIIKEETRNTSGDDEDNNRGNTRGLHRKIVDRIINEVLTDEQAEQFRERLSQMSRRGRGRDDDRQDRRGRSRRPERGRRGTDEMPPEEME